MAALPSYPKLRNDLLIRRHNTEEGVFFVVKHPLTGSFFKLGEIEHFIAGHLDGSTALATIRQRVEERFDISLAPATLSQFVEQLQRMRFLETDAAPSQRETRRRGPIRGSLLYLRIKILDPDRLLDALLSKLRFFFTWYFLAVSAFLILLALMVTISSWREIGHEVRGLYRFEALFLAWITMLLVTTAHEFAHGLTCKYFGGEVHELGFMLLYFQPAFYCNVSDAWLFPEKSKRLWVSFAGAYLEIFLWAVATLTWRVTDPQTWISFVVLVIVLTSGIKTLLNLNPLMKLDGYYLLSDYLEIPNLRQKSLGYLGGQVQRLLGRGSSETEEVTPRRRRIYLLYGVLAGVYSYLLLSLIAIRFGGFLVERYQGLGFLLFTFVLLRTFRNPVGRVRRGLPHFFRTGLALGASFKRPLKVSAGLLAATAVLFLGSLQLKVGGDFEVLPAHNADVRAPIEGVVEVIYVQEGDRVHKGDPVAHLSVRDHRTELEKTEAEIAEVQARLKMLQRGPRREEVEIARREMETARAKFEHARKRHLEAEQIRAQRLSKARSAVQKAEEQLQYSRNNLERFKSLAQSEFIVSRKDVEEAEREVALREAERAEAQAELQMVLFDELALVRQELAVSENELKEAESRLDLLRAGSRREEIEALQARIAQLEALRGYLNEQIQLAGVTSPISGTVTTSTHKLRELIGQNMKKGDLIAEVHALETITAEIAVPEKEIADVQVGQRVILKARAYPERHFDGKVSSVGTTATEDDGVGWNVVLVSTELENPSFILKPGMTGKAKIFCGKRRLFDLIRRRLAHTLRVEVWSWW